MRKYKKLVDLLSIAEYYVVLLVTNLLGRNVCLVHSAFSSGSGDPGSIPCLCHTLCIIPHRMRIANKGDQLFEVKPGPS